jgi:hypothetical protein
MNEFLNDQHFISDRMSIQRTLVTHDVTEQYISVPLSKAVFFRTTGSVMDDNALYQLIGINASMVDKEYVEIFVLVDLIETLKHFDGKAVKTQFFDGVTFSKMIVVDESNAKNGYTRPEWRRLQKHIKKEIKNIIQADNMK